MKRVSAAVFMVVLSLLAVYLKHSSAEQDQLRQEAVRAVEMQINQLRGALPGHRDIPYLSMRQHVTSEIERLEPENQRLRSKVSHQFGYARLRAELASVDEDIARNATSNSHWSAEHWAYNTSVGGSPPGIDEVVALELLQIKQADMKPVFAFDWNEVNGRGEPPRLAHVWLFPDRTSTTGRYRCLLALADSCTGHWTGTISAEEAAQLLSGVPRYAQQSDNDPSASPQFTLQREHAPSVSGSVNSRAATCLVRYVFDHIRKWHASGVLRSPDGRPPAFLP